jgi:hypothetical protein
MTYGSIAGRMRRAQRNQTGATFSFDDLKLLAQAGFLHRLALREIDELCETVGVEPPTWDITFNKPQPPEPTE